MTIQSSIAQTIALAGIVQSACLADQLARTGAAPAESFNSSINSLFKFDADSPSDVYGGVIGVKLGLQTLRGILSGKNKTDYKTIVRYTLGMLFLQKKLSANNELMAIVQKRLEHSALKANHFSDHINGTASSIAAIYQDTLSTFRFRIQISGNIEQLQNTQNVDNIRALLLAGIRSSVLWRQSGGKRWQLITARHRLLTTANQLLQSLEY